MSEQIYLLVCIEGMQAYSQPLHTQRNGGMKDRIDLQACALQLLGKYFTALIITYYQSLYTTGAIFPSVNTCFFYTVFEVSYE